MLDRLLPLRALTDLLSVDEATIGEWISSGHFPAGVPLPNGEPRWRESEVTIWMARLGLVQALATQETQGRQEVDIDSLGELSQDILEALALMEDGWHPSKDVAAKVGGDVDTTAGNWGRAVKELREAGLIASGPRGLSLVLAPARQEPGTCRAGAQPMPGSSRAPAGLQPGKGDLQGSC